MLWRHQFKGPSAEDWNRHTELIRKSTMGWTGFVAEKAHSVFDKVAPELEITRGDAAVRFADGDPGVAELIRMLDLPFYFR